MALNTGADGAALAQSVTSPTDAVRAALVLLRPDGNRPCMLQDDPSTALGPNLGDGSVFLFGTYRTARHGERYFVNATASREGLWQVCAGPPRPIAVVQGTGSLAPDVGSGSARFTTIRTLPRPMADQALAFIASYDIDDGGPAPIRGALWWHRAGSNQLLAQTGDGSTASGPNYQGAVFEFIDSVSSTFDAAGPYIALETSALTPQNQRINGLWRWRAGAPPEPVALEGQNGAVAPGPGQAFSSLRPGARPASCSRQASRSRSTASDRRRPPPSTISRYSKAATPARPTARSASMPGRPTMAVSPYRPPSPAGPIAPQC